MSAYSLVSTTTKPKFCVGKSKIKNGGDGLFAKKHIPKGVPIVIYWGTKITDDEVYNVYMEDKKAYQELNRWIRGTSNNFVVKGRKDKNLNLGGIYVNDIASISCTPSEVNELILRNYAQTIKKCNLKTVDTEDFPIYVSTKRIKKGEEFYAHYGIGYWLAHIGCCPDEISDLNKKYDFDSLY